MERISRREVIEKEVEDKRKPMPLCYYWPIPADHLPGHLQRKHRREAVARLNINVFPRLHNTAKRLHRFVFHFCCCNMIQMKLSGIKTSLSRFITVKKNAIKMLFNPGGWHFHSGGGFTSCKVTVGSSLESPLYLHRLMSVDIKKRQQPGLMY